MLQTMVKFFMKKDDIKNSADLFFYKANSDLNSAKYLLKAFENSEIEIDLETIMFHFQQSAEKLLKSLLSHHKIRVSKTHDIKEILRIAINNNIEIIGNTGLLIDLTSYAIEGRYAIIHDDLDDTNKYIKILEELQLFVKKQISSENN